MDDKNAGVDPLSPPDQCVVSGNYAFMLRVSGIFGFAPLRFKARGNGYTVSLSYFMCIYSFILSTALAVTSFSGIRSRLVLDMPPNQTLSIPSTTVFASDIIMVTVMACNGAYGAPGRMRSMFTFMDTIASVDRSFGVLYDHARERRIWAALITFLLVFFALMTHDLYNYIVLIVVRHRHGDVVVHRIVRYVVTILQVQFAFTAMVVQTRFKVLNEALALTVNHLSEPTRKGQKAKNSESQKLFAIKVAPAELQSGSEKAAVIVRKSVSGEPRLAVSPSDAVHRIALLHAALSTAVQRIASGYGSSLIIMLMSTLLHLVSTPFTILKLYSQGPQLVHFFAQVCVWAVLHILKLFVVVEPCHNTIVEGKKTQSLVCRLILVSPTSGPLPARLELFQRQLMMRSPSYDPMGLCTLNRALITSMFGAVVSYLVILIQFQGIGL